MAQAQDNPQPATPTLANNKHGHASTRGFFQPIDAASLAAFRIAFGLLMLWEVSRYFQRGWIRRYYIDPDFHFRYYGFEWITPWPGNGMVIHFAVMGLLAAAIAAGLWYRLCAVLFFLGFAFWFLLEQSNYLNHFYLICLVSGLLMFMPAHRCWSLDALRRPQWRSSTIPVWPVWLLRFQIGIVYFFGGVAKLNPDWLAGEPMRAWLLQRSHFTLLWGAVPVGRLFELPAAVWFFAYGGLLLDLLAFPLLLWSRTRTACFVVTVFFHVMNAWLFQIGVFPWFMIAATMIFFPPDWPRWLFGRMPRRTDEMAAVPVSTLRRRLTLTLLAGWCSVQVLMPLRHFLYPGEVHWTEEGHNFSWHMKLRDKETHRLDIVARDPSSGDVLRVDPRAYLTKRQQRKMATRPDLLLQFAHHVSDQLATQRGAEHIAIHAYVYCSLNSRPAARLIDPQADLAAEPRSIAPKHWILPLPE